VVEPVRKAAAEVMKGAEKALPPPLAGASTLPDRLQSATVELNLTGDTLLRLDLEARDEKSAQVVRDLANAAYDMLKGMYPEMRKDMLKQAPPDLKEPLAGVVDDLVAGVRVSQESAHVI